MEQCVNGCSTKFPDTYNDLITHMHRLENILANYSQNALKKAHKEMDSKAGFPPSKQSKGIDMFIATEMANNKIFELRKTNGSN